MTPHQRIELPDLSVAVRIYPGGRWKVLHMNGEIYECDASRFCDEQNRFVREFFRESVTRVRREGRP